MLDEQPAFDKTRLTADSAFPLCDRLAGAAACYLASTLIVDENPSISDIFGERCRDALESAYGEIPFDRHSIVNVYP